MFLRKLSRQINDISMNEFIWNESVKELLEYVSHVSYKTDNTLTVTV